MRHPPKSDHLVNMPPPTPCALDNKCRLSVQHLLKVFLGNKLFVKKRIRTISFVLSRLEHETTCDRTLKLRLRKMKLLTDEELFLCAISKRVAQFEQHLGLLFRTNKKLIRSLRKESNLVELSQEFGHSISADDNEFFQEEGNNNDDPIDSGHSSNFMGHPTQQKSLHPFVDKRWSERLKADDIESHAETKEELKLYVVQRKFYHFLHGISDVLEPIRKLHSRSKQRSPHISTSSGGPAEDESAQLNEELSRRNLSSSDSEAESACTSNSGFDSSRNVTATVSSLLATHHAETGKLKTSIYKRNVMNYLERNLRHRKSMAKSVVEEDEDDNNDDLDDNNNTTKEYGSSRDGDGFEDADTDTHRRSRINTDVELALDQEMEDEQAVKMKAMPKDEIKIMNFFNSIYNFNQQQHSAHLKPPTAALDQFEGNHCELQKERRNKEPPPS